MRPESEYSFFPYHPLAGVAIATDFPRTSFVLGSCSTFCLKVAEQPDINAATKIRLATRMRSPMFLTSFLRHSGCEILLVFSIIRQIRPACTTSSFLCLLSTRQTLNVSGDHLASIRWIRPTRFSDSIPADDNGG